MTKMLELVNVKKVYKTKSGDTNALNEISLSFPKSGLVFITGKSGSGKTTLLNVIGGLDGIDSGNIILDGKDFSTFSVNDYNSYRNTFIGFIFQEYNLLPEYTVQKNLEIATELQGVKVPKERIDEILKLVDLEGLNFRKTNELSGGQKQRVAIARALIKNPKIIMADEPTGALDSATGISVISTLKKLSQDKLVIVVSHDLELAEKYADRIIRLVDGNIVEDVIISEEEIKANVLENDNELKVKLGASLNEKETELLLKSIREKKEVKFIDKIGARSKKKTPPLKEPKGVEPPKFIKSKMKVKSSVGLGFRAIFVKPVRLIFTVLLAAIAFALFGLFDTIAAYDNARAIANLLRASEYDSIVISSEYISEGNSCAIRLSGDTIKDLNSKTGYSFKPLYEINDKGASGITDKTFIEDLNPQSSEVVVGSSYYLKYLDDFIEFSESEINTESKIIDKGGFNYKIVHGEYPKLPSKLTDEHGEAIKGIEKFKEVAISTYTAQSILFYLSPSSDSSANLGGRIINEMKDLVGASFSVKISGQNISYKITGIIDCGEIPEKFDELKTAGVGQVRTSLKNSFETFINSGAYLKLFVPEGYVSEWREFLDRSNTHILGGNNVEIPLGKSKTILSNNGETAFYNVEENASKVIYFDSEKKSTGENEVVISPNLIKSIYGERFKAMNSAFYFESEISKLTSKVSFAEKVNAMKALAPLFRLENNLPDEYPEPPTTLKINKTDITTGEKTSIEFNIVGVYVDVNADFSASGLFKVRPLMFSKSGFNKLGVSPVQGEFARIIAPQETGVFATNSLAEYMSKTDGLNLKWYKNDVLSSIEQNKDSLKDFSNLFLYVSIALAIFSVFMLFNYISSSIVSKKQSIGVLRALGSNGKDIFTMFTAESLFISIVNAILANVMAFVGCIFVNMYIKNIMHLTINFAIFGFRQIIIISAISIITGIVSSLIPIIRICKEKPIELIRKD